RSVFCAPSRNLKKLAIPNYSSSEVILVRFRKKCDNHKLRATSHFDQFFVHCLRILKYCPFPTLMASKLCVHA
ncbi:hypothetical protein B296_00042104, partial [Ensete ventricosum]